MKHRVFSKPCLVFIHACIVFLFFNSPAHADNPQQENDMPPSMLLQKAFEFFRIQEYGHSAKMFMSAIRTGALNDAGKVIAYWHASTAYRYEGQHKEAHEALASFIAVSEELIEDEKEQNPSSTHSFSLRFDLHSKLAHARGQQYALWAAKHPTFGTSPQRAVPVHSVAEIDYFLDAAQPCNHQKGPREQHVYRLKEGSSQVDQVATFCSSEPSKTATYYFQWLPQ